MNIPRVKFKNFFSFLEGEMIFSKGVNYVLGDNGSGKSTAVIYAICWGLYGITPKGLRGDDVINSGVGRNCMVEVQVDIGKDRYIVRRYRKHSEYRNGIFVWKNGEDISTTTAPATDRLIEEILGMDFTTFICCCVFPQNALIRFSDIGDAEKKAILERTRQGFPFDEWRSKAKNKLDEVYHTVTSLSNEKEKVLVSLGDGQTILRQQRNAENNWGLEHKREIDDLDNERRSVAKQIEGYDLDSLRKKEDELKERYNNCTFQTHKEFDRSTEFILEEMSKAQGLLRTANKQLTDTKAKQLSIQNDIDKYSKLMEKGECPILPVTCEQLSKGGAFDSEKEAMEIKCKALEDSTVTLEKIIAHSDTVYKERSEERERYIKIYHKDAETLVELRRITDKIESSTSVFKDLVDRYERLGVQFRNKREEKFAGVDTIEMEKLLKEYHRKITKLTNRINDFSEERLYYEFWLIGYGKSGLRSFLLDQVCIDLEELAQGYLSELTDGRMELTISTQSRLASGELREKISVNVSSPKGMTKYKGASGGQERRIDLALLLAMKDIARENLSSKPEILFIDEVFDSLDATGKERAVILLAEGEGTTVLITHDPELVQVLPFVDATEFELVDGISVKKEV